VQVGDLVVATFKAVTPTSWYKRLYESQEPAIVVGWAGNDGYSEPYIEIYYRGKPRLCAATNLKIVSKYELSSR
jgi:hypothetical protein